MTRTLRVAATSPEIRLGEVAGNLQRIRGALEDAAAQDAQLIVVPELATSGYVFTDRSEAAEASLTRDHPAWKQLAEALPPGVVAVVGYAESRGAHAWSAHRRLSQGAPLGRGGPPVRAGNERGRVVRHSSWSPRRRDLLR